MIQIIQKPYFYIKNVLLHFVGIFLLIFLIWKKWRSLCKPVRKMYLPFIIKNNRQLFISLMQVASLPFMVQFMTTYTLQWYIHLITIPLFIYLIAVLLKKISEQLYSLAETPFHCYTHLWIPNSMRFIFDYWEQNDNMREWEILKDVFTGNDPNLYYQIKPILPFIELDIESKRNKT